VKLEYFAVQKHIIQLYSEALKENILLRTERE